MFRPLFPTLFVPMILLGAGCTQTTSVSIEPVVERVEDAQAEISTEVVFEDGNYTVAPPFTTRTATSIVWNAQKRVGAKHNGTIDISEGDFLVEQGGIVGGAMVVDMSTIVDLDLTDEKFNTMLVTHLKSDDFFAVETYPTATFAISEVAALKGVEGATHRVIGDMTIKGTTNEISFPASFAQVDGGIQVTGTATLDRTLWDVRYGSNTFFNNLGDELIEDEFTLIFDMLFTASK